MSLSSMTGYGTGQAVSKGCRVEVQLSSVNRKQLDVHVSLPRRWSVLESRVQEEVQHALTRGRVSGEIALTYYGSARQAAVTVDHDLARAVVKQLRDEAGRLKLVDDICVSRLLDMPDVVSFRSEPDVDVETVWAVVRKALRQALRELVAMRHQEGQALQADLEKRFKKMETLVERIRKRAPRVVDHYRRELKARLTRLDVDLAQAEPSVLREVVMFADRCDISEELTRLDSHLVQGRKKLAAREPVGRSLDFLAQEMFREINTIGSKASDGKITQQVVAFKTELERFREQIQNVE
jgi:uncharacterized protein (TIGR00255 family)